MGRERGWIESTEWERENDDLLLRKEVAMGGGRKGALSFT